MRQVLFYLLSMFIVQSVAHSKMPGFLNQLSYTVKFGEQSGRRFVTLETKVAGKSQEISFLAIKNSAQMAAASPRQIEASIKEARKLSMKGAMVSTLKRFPMESFVFFVALGALAAKDSITQFHLNPRHIETFVEGQGHASTHIAFAAFMMANGATEHALRPALSGSPLGRHMVPYLGMTAGLVASNLIHELAAIPGLYDCAKSLLPMGLTGGCDQAFKFIAQGSLEGKLHEWLPSLFGMFASTALSGGLQFITSKIFQTASLKLTAGAFLDFGLSLIGGPTGVAIRFGIRLMQTTLFVYLDTWIQPWFVYYWTKHVNLGPKKSQLRLTLADRLSSPAPLAGTSSREETIGTELGETVLKTEGMPSIEALASNLSSIYQRDRQNELSDFLMAQNSWSESFANFSSSYHSAKLAYREILFAVLGSLKKDNIYDQVSINGINHLYGVEFSNQHTMALLSQLDKFSANLKTAHCSGQKNLTISTSELDGLKMSKIYEHLEFDDEGKFLVGDERGFFKKNQAAKSYYLNQIAHLGFIPFVQPQFERSDKDEKALSGYKVTLIQLFPKESDCPPKNPAQETKQSEWIQFLETIRKDFASDKSDVQAKALWRMVVLAERGRTARKNDSGQGAQKSASDTASDFALQFVQLLGKPSPSFTAGEWWLHATGDLINKDLQGDIVGRTSVLGVLIDKWSRSGIRPDEEAAVRRWFYENDEDVKAARRANGITHEAILQMLSGPAKSDHSGIVKYGLLNGMPTAFNFPRVLDKSVPLVMVNQDFRNLPLRQLVSAANFKVEGSNQSVIQYLINNLPPDLQNLSFKNNEEREKWFQSYWVNNFEPHFARAWHKLQFAFLKNIQNFEKIYLSGSSPLVNQVSEELKLMLTLLQFTEGCDDQGKCKPLIVDSKVQNLILRGEPFEVTLNGLALETKNAIAEFVGFHEAAANPGAFASLLKWKTPTPGQNSSGTDSSQKIFELHHFQYPTPIVPLEEFHKTSEQTKKSLMDILKRLKDEGSKSNEKTKQQMAVLQQIQAIIEELSTYSAAIIAPSIQDQVQNARPNQAMREVCLEMQKKLTGLNRPKNFECK